MLSGERVFLNVGTRATIPPIPGLAEASPLTNIELLELDRLPKHLVVLGGGYVGLEFAQAYRRFGSRVTVIEHGPQLLSREDADVAEEIARILRSKEIEILLKADVRRVEGRSGESVRVHAQTGEGERTIEASDILAATGRTPNTAGIGLESIGVELDQRGYVRVNDRLETTTPGVWAIGECAGSPQFTHVSFDDFRIIRDNLAGHTPQHARPARPLLSLHRSAPRASRPERRRGETKGHRNPRRPTPDGQRAANADDG